MTALQRLQDAITKLERLEASTYGVEFDPKGFIYNYGGDENDVQIERFVTLDRTLDAQLSIFAYGATLVGPIPGCILALADSILDGER